MKSFRRPFWAALLVIFIWFGASGVFGPLFSKLSTVQEKNAYGHDRYRVTPRAVNAVIMASAVMAVYSRGTEWGKPALVVAEVCVVRRGAR